VKVTVPPPRAVFAPGKYASVSTTAVSLILTPVETWVADCVVAMLGLRGTHVFTALALSPGCISPMLRTRPRR
jgi:hypothetical protein